MAKQPESKLSTAIMKKWRAMGAFCYKVHGGEFQMSGIPDISGVYKGHSVWCETKMPGNKTSLVQDVRINQLRKAGAHVVVAYNVADAADVIKHLELLSRLNASCDVNECLYTTLKELKA
jgi:hypothetical protein